MQYLTKKGFLNGSQYARRGTLIEAEGARAKELLRLKLVEEVKNAPDPANKMAPEPPNKAPDAERQDEAHPSGSGGNGKGQGPAAAARSSAAAAFVDGTIPDVTARIEGADKDLLRAALEAEVAKGDKARKGVVDALTAAVNG